MENIQFWKYQKYPIFSNSKISDIYPIHIADIYRANPESDTAVHNKENKLEVLCVTSDLILPLTLSNTLVVADPRESNLSNNNNNILQGDSKQTVTVTDTVPAPLLEDRWRILHCWLSYI